jgi:lipoate-protein ligase A
MKYLDLSFADPAANLACDEALLDLFETGKRSDEILRVWESPIYFIVLGHSNRWSSEISCSAALGQKIALLRRVSGGGAVVQGPGCLNYALVLDSQRRDLANVRETFRHVLRRHAGVVESLSGMEASIQGISDLTANGRKFSGNAQYRKSRFVLVHGTFLLNFELSLIAQCLKIPPRQPDYRRNRPHLEFIANLNIEAARLRDALRIAWRAEEPFIAIPLRRIRTLMDQRYNQDTWTRKF